MNIALILAGGVGSRMEQDVPKQFLCVYEKPILMYTLEAFEKHPDIDGIMVVCLEGWEEILKAYAKSYNISKLKWIVPGGESGHASTALGIEKLKEICDKDDIVVIHDGIRPMVNQDVISDCIVICRQHGIGLAAIPCQETIVRTSNGVSGNTDINRSEIMRVQTPQAYRFEKISWGYEEAKKRGIDNEIYANTLMLHLGEEVYFSVGSSKNLKITTKEDLEMFRALCRIQMETKLI